MKQILVRIKEDVVLTLDSYCEAHGIVRNSYIAQAVIEKLNKDIRSSEVIQSNSKTTKKK